MIKASWAPTYNHSLPEGHRFPMIKYDLLKQQLLHEGVLSEENFFYPKSCTFETAALVHDTNYLNRLVNLSLTPLEIRRSGFPLSKSLIDREFLIAGGTIDACDYAIQHGISFNLAGGTHHAFSNQAEGFCLLNDQAIAAAHLVKSKQIYPILIIDLDVHQGNGTASIFENNNKIYTFSMHGAQNFPNKKEKSFLDIALPTNTQDDSYLKILSQNINQLFEKVKPKFVFYQAGVDILATDSLGKLSISIEGCKKRDDIILNYCHKEKIPLVVTMGGGYSKEIKYILDAHVNTYKVANYYY